MLLYRPTYSFSGEIFCSPLYNKLLQKSSFGLPREESFVIERYSTARHYLFTDRLHEHYNMSNICYDINVLLKF